MPCTAAGQFNKLRYPVTPRSPVRATELGALSPEAGSARTAASSGHIMCNRPPNQTPADRASVQALMLFSRLSSAAGLYAAPKRSIRVIRYSWQSSTSWDLHRDDTVGGWGAKAEGSVQVFQQPEHESGTSARAWDISLATSESDSTVPAAMCETNGAMTFRDSSGQRSAWLAALASYVILLQG